MRDCVFCRIVAGELKAHRVYENESVPIPRYAGDGGSGIQYIIRGSVTEDLASVASQIRSAVQ